MTANSSRAGAAPFAECHTPGPWSHRIYATGDSPEQLKALGLEPVRLLTNEGQAIIMGPTDRVALVDMQTKVKRGTAYKAECPERDANARLIAAAPDLLAALKVAQKLAASGPAPLPPSDPRWAQIADAIAKAGG